jgi:hypothetical protein
MSDTLLHVRLEEMGAMAVAASANCFADIFKQAGLTWRGTNMGDHFEITGRDSHDRTLVESVVTLLHGFGIGGARTVTGGPGNCCFGVSIVCIKADDAVAVWRLADKAHEDYWR